MGFAKGHWNGHFLLRFIELDQFDAKYNFLEVGMADNLDSQIVRFSPLTPTQS